MPQERESNSPVVSADEWRKISESGPRELMAARLMMASSFDGIPVRPYLVGNNDHAPILKRVATFCDLVYKLLDATNDVEPGIPATVEDAASAVYDFMEDSKL